MDAPLKMMNERLKWAVRYEDADECRRVLAEGAQVPAESREQVELLINAIEAPGESAVEILKLLLEAGCRPDGERNSPGAETPLVAAATKGRLDLMKILAAAGADIHWRGPAGDNASSLATLFMAVENRGPEKQAWAEVCAWLDSQGVHFDPDCSSSRRMVLMTISEPCSWPNIPRLAELGVDTGVQGWTPFLWKIVRGEATVEDALAMPAEEMEQTDSYQRTPFLMAVAANRQDLAAALLARGANLCAGEWRGATALHLAAENDLPEMVAWLVSQGLPVDVLNHRHHTPLWSAMGYSLAAARKLLELGANVRAEDDNGFQAIHEVINHDMLELLLDAGADVNSISGGGSWPLADVCGSGDAAVAKLLLQRGAMPDLTATGETALFSAVSSDSLDCVRLLLDAGASVNAESVDGWTCLRNSRSAPMAKLLLERGGDPGIAEWPGRLPEDWSLPLEVTALFKNARIEQGRT